MFSVIQLVRTISWKINQILDFVILQLATLRPVPPDFYRQLTRCYGHVTDGSESGRKSSGTGVVSRKLFGSELSSHC